MNDGRATTTSGEYVFFKGSDVTVTSSRFIVSSQTYAMSGVTAVKAYEKGPNRLPPIILGVLGVLAMSSGGGGVPTGVLMLIGAIAWASMQKPEFWIILSTASGESKVLAHRDRVFVTQVVDALNDAIIYRG